MTDHLQGRSPENQARNEQSCEWIFIGGGLMGLFALAFFVGQMLVTWLVA